MEFNGWIEGQSTASAYLCLIFIFWLPLVVAAHDVPGEEMRAHQVGLSTDQHVHRN